MVIFFQNYLHVLFVTQQSESSGVDIVQSIVVQSGVSTWIAMKLGTDFRDEL